MDTDEQLDPPVDRPLVRYPIRRWRALIDAEDLRRVQAHQWMIDRDGYARSRTAGFLHRYVLGVPNDGPPVDHINRHRLDCRKCNLRVVTGSLNNLNTAISVTGGIRQAGNGFVARLTYRGEYIHIGTFSTRSTAQIMRDEAIKRIMDGETTITVVRRGVAVDKEISHAEQDRSVGPTDGSEACVEAPTATGTE